MDTEGGEIKILPQLKPFLAKYKPNILLSLVRTKSRERGRERVSCYACWRSMATALYYLLCINWEC